MPDAEPTVTKFYTPIMGDYPQQAQELLMHLLLDEYKTPNEFEDAIMAAAKHAEEANR